MTFRTIDATVERPGEVAHIAGSGAGASAGLGIGGRALCAVWPGG